MACWVWVDACCNPALPFTDTHAGSQTVVLHLQSKLRSDVPDIRRHAGYQHLGARPGRRRGSFQGAAAGATEAQARGHGHEHGHGHKHEQGHETLAKGISMRVGMAWSPWASPFLTGKC
eukprot:358139-Chlamydomonas_euryale.AAC.6